MAVTPSKRTSIMAYVLARFSAINGGANYNFDLTGRVHLWRDLEKVPWDIENGDANPPSINIKDTVATTRQIVSKKHEHDLEIEVTGIVEAGTSPAVEGQKLIRDIIFAIGQDRTWNGLAYDTDPRDEELVVVHDSKKVCGVRVRFFIKYRTDSFNPAYTTG